MAGELYAELKSVKSELDATNQLANDLRDAADLQRIRGSALRALEAPTVYVYPANVGRLGLLPRNIRNPVIAIYAALDKINRRVAMALEGARAAAPVADDYDIGWIDDALRLRRKAARAIERVGPTLNVLAGYTPDESDID